MRYDSPSQQEPPRVTPEQRELWNQLHDQMDELRDRADNAARLCVHLVNADQIDQAHVEAETYFALLGEWNALNARAVHLYTQMYPADVD